MQTKALHIALWVVQILLAALLISGAIMKFMPIAHISQSMPWTGDVPPLIVRLLGCIDLAGALGLVLPGLLRIKPRLTPWAAVGVVALMLCATLFHVSREETPVIGLNLVAGALAAFVAWGRFKTHP